jgi:hypothetical protein
MPGYYHGKKYNRLLPEIITKVEAFIKVLFEWVLEQEFEN